MIDILEDIRIELNAVEVNLSKNVEASFTFPKYENAAVSTHQPGETVQSPRPNHLDLCEDTKHLRGSDFVTHHGSTLHVSSRGARIASKLLPSIVWFCSNCGSGPTSDWQETCGECDHHRCSYCTLEETG
jgi:hypothetical protein